MFQQKLTKVVGLASQNMVLLTENLHFPRFCSDNLLIYAFKFVDFDHQQ